MRRLPLLLGAVLAAAACGDDPVPVPVSPPTLRLIPPLQDAEVGEMLRLEAGATAEVYRVVGGDEYQVQVELVKYQDGAPVTSPSVLTWHRNSFSIPADAVIRAIDQDRIEVGGKTYDCWRLAVASRVRQLYFWISDEIPVHGVLKVAAVVKGQADEAHAAHLADWAPKSN